MNVYTLRTREEHAQGVLPFQDANGNLQADTVWFFYNVGEPGLRMHSYGLSVPIYLIALNERFDAIARGGGYRTILLPRQIVDMPSGTKHVVEYADPDVDKQRSWHFLVVRP
jgi:hypothetical protein